MKTSAAISLDAALDGAREWVQLSPAERESFFAAIARHRRMSWRVTIAAGVAIGVSGLVVATLMAPLFYAVLALILDIVNLAVPMPNVVAAIGAILGPLMDAASPPLWGWVRFGLLA